MTPEPETVSDQSLREAERMLTAFEDIAVEEGHDVPPWMLAAREAVQYYRQEVDP